MTVAVVITTWNHAHYLGQALDSVRNQTRPADAVVVVDDGSTDDPAGVTAHFTGVRLISRQNGGLAAARNTGLAASNTACVVFLDADDRLLPGAIAAGLACFARAPESGLVYGAHRSVDGTGRSLGEYFEPAGDHPYQKLLEGNFIAMHGAVMYRRDRLLAIGGFDETLRRSEDYDVYLRMAREYPVAGHPDVVAEYRRHGDNMSVNHLAMLRTTLEVHARQAAWARRDPQTRVAWAAGRRRWRRHYAEALAGARHRASQQGGTLAASLAGLAAIAAVSPRVALAEVSRGMRHWIELLAGRESGVPGAAVKRGSQKGY